MRLGPRVSERSDDHRASACSHPDAVLLVCGRCNKWASVMMTSIWLQLRANQLCSPFVVSWSLQKAYNLARSDLLLPGTL